MTPDRLAEIKAQALDTSTQGRFVFSACAKAHVLALVEEVERLAAELHYFRLNEGLEPDISRRRERIP